MSARALVCNLIGHKPSRPYLHAACGCPKRGQFYCRRCRRWFRLGGGDR